MISKTEEAICGGQIRILIDANLKNHISVFKQIKQSIDERIPGVLEQWLPGLQKRQFLSTGSG